MRKYLWVQFSFVAAGVIFSAIAGQISGIGWALAAGFLSGVTTRSDNALMNPKRY